MSFLQTGNEHGNTGQKSPVYPEHNSGASLLFKVPTYNFYTNKKNERGTTMEEKETKRRFNAWAAIILELLA